jgi:hypothetical protein
MPEERVLGEVVNEVILTDFLDGDGFDADHFRGELLLLPLLLLLHEGERNDLADRVLRFIGKLKIPSFGKGRTVV